MQLTSVEIEGYRSINETTQIIFDPHVTIILGANDHGKTNVLSALRHLNEDYPFDADIDINWDRASDLESLPRVVWELTLNDTEKTYISDILKRTNNREAAEKFDEVAWTRFTELAQKISPDTTDGKPVKELVETLVGLLEAARFLRDGELPSPQALLEEAIREVDRLEAELAETRVEVEAASAALTSATASGDGGQIKRARNRNDEAVKAKLDTEKELEAAAYAGWLPFAAEYAAARTVKTEFKKAIGELSFWNTDKIKIARIGARGDRKCILPDLLSNSEVETYIFKNLPRVELISPVDRIADAVSRDEIEESEFEFMRGVFYYAGLDANKWDRIFSQDDVSARQLDIASDTLNATLQKSWSQGRDLGFKLQHSNQSRVELYIKDPVVKDRYVRASRRSTGFTHFFTLKTILHSRQTEAPAASYIWLFDEPGLYLHPSGQQDLLQVIETLATSNQIIYTAHSLFMINKNYPARHRLIAKEKIGTRVDGKPYVGRWKAAIESLGLAMPGTILFANKILLVEGDSDPIFLYAMLLKFIEEGLLDVDINDFSIVSTGDSRNADAIIRYLSDAPTKPKIAALFDGDEGGRERQRKLKSLMKSFNIDNVCVDGSATIEDLLPAFEKALVPAAAAYLSKLSGKACEDVSVGLLAAFQKRNSGKAVDARSGTAEWIRIDGKEIAELDSEPSSVGVAREYVLALQDVKLGGESGRGIKLALWIAKALELQSQTVDQDAVLAG